MSTNLQSGCLTLIPIVSEQDLNFQSSSEKIKIDDGTPAEKKNKFSLLGFNQKHELKHFQISKYLTI